MLVVICLVFSIYSAVCKGDLSGSGRLVEESPYNVVSIPTGRLMHHM